MLHERCSDHIEILCSCALMADMCVSHGVQLTTDEQYPNSTIQCKARWTGYGGVILCCLGPSAALRAMYHINTSRHCPRLEARGSFLLLPALQPAYLSSLRREN
jgi:hypothetical protein